MKYSLTIYNHTPKQGHTVFSDLPTMASAVKIAKLAEKIMFVVDEVDENYSEKMVYQSPAYKNHPDSSEAN